MTTALTRYLILPGWQGSGPQHWQSHWQQLLPNAQRVEQHDWQWPLRADWVAQLEQQIAADPAPTILIAHSLGCITLAHWAAQASPALLSRIKGALLVAPADVERANCAPALQNFAPIPNAVLPFPSLLIGSTNDPAASAERALCLANQWGSRAVVLEQAGHINTSAGFTQWEAGFAYLYQLQRQIEQQALKQA
ncbi:alpha/beta hydrolase [Pseudomonas neustonica]|uniref:Alpha/beta hydrolase n=1 Tax=Pseudomonas neustonica TaxID=2487346 RepID=A0ABX9XHM3_9PSED|nr:MULTISPECIES: alpha/beta hydrolase [Pseudomonas]ROZ84156.1 alpha/beta hydrolase [Pseudomonas sp. SSM44]ROZ84403.1 alpha/beta hydrolase [Pseudomonas neustonica]|tara:strand:- start:10819 stop:11400 length:582 start_codon:yes stop_codon:yes gene_type:complete